MDGTVFGEPARFVPARKPNPHLAFAHGPWHCLGAPLARLELQVVFTTLFDRLPSLRLAVDAGQLRLTDDQFASSLVALPVMW